MFCAFSWGGGQGSLGRRQPQYLGSSLFCLRWGHANLLCIALILAYIPKDPVLLGMVVPRQLSQLREEGVGSREGGKPQQPVKDAWWGLQPAGLA